MGIPTTDNKNPGRRQVQRFSVAGGLSNNQGDQESKAVDNFLLLKNCRVDNRLNVVTKRPGSLTETITSSLGLPLGVGEFTSPTVGTIGQNRTLLFNFGGSVFYQNQAGTYSVVPADTRFTNFSSSTRQTQFSKLGGILFIAGGLPAKWQGPGWTIDRAGIIPPTSPITIASTSSGTGVTLTEGTSYVYTYYQSLTGVESDWSTPSASTGAVANKAIELTIPVELGNFDRIRIYRYLDGGAAPYFVNEIPASTASYTDTTPDTSLAEPLFPRYDHNVPPSQVFVCAKFAQCIWCVDASNPFRLVFSKPYIGVDADLEYFPIDNYLISNEPITGLFVLPGKMLVFHPRGISYVSGSSVDDFVFQPFSAGVGTVFPNSISSNGTDVVFLAEQGFVAQSLGGGSPRHISREIDLELQTFLAASYNTGLYMSTCWNPSLRQFIFMLNAQSSVGAPWEELGTGSTASAVAGWQTTPDLVDDTWEDTANVNSAASMRVKFWGWSPELSSGSRNIWMEYTFSDLADDNVTGAYPIFVFHPQPSADTSDPQQDKTYLGYWTGTQGQVKTLFRKDKNTDDGAAYTAEIITGRLIPGDDSGGYKYFKGIGFLNSYSDPTSDSLATIKYLIDFDDPHIRSYASSLITVSDSTDVKRFPQGLGRHIHLYISDTSQSQTKVLLGEFFIHYRERYRKEGR